MTPSLRCLDVGVDHPNADTALFDGVRLDLAAGRRIALVGDNGAGKSTLLRVAAGRQTPDRGRVVRLGSIGWLDQALDDDGPPGSGGERQRARLAALRRADPDLLLLDEPTLHLDEDGLAWLEAWLTSVRAGVLVVAHDRAFLEAIATDVAFLERGRLHLERGGYADATTRRAARDDAQRRRHRADEARQAALRDAFQRERSRARSAGHFDHRRADGQAHILVRNRAESASKTLARRAAAIAERIARVEVAERPFEDRRRLTLHAAPQDAGPTEVVVARDLTVHRGGRTIVDGVDLVLRRGERLALIGPNGCGKTTLLEVLAGVRPPAAGEVRHGPGLRVALVDQVLAPAAGAATVGALLRAARAELRDADVWRLTAEAGVPSSPERPLAELSGGERRRLALAQVAASDAHLLVLDEPTHHLDVRAIEALEGLLQAYAGAVLLVSHDRRLVEAIGARRWRLGPRLSNAA